MLTVGEQKLLARYLIQLLQLQKRDASLEEFQLWRQRVKAGFSGREKKKTPKFAGSISSRHFFEERKHSDYERFFESEE